MKPILEIQNISKKFRIQHEKQTYLNLRDSIVSMFKTNTVTTEDFFALRDVSFNVNAGESIGIIGKNGAGKSTLLKILSKITPPSSGKIISRGRIASLLEVGTGFHPELTGKENVYLNGSILGMRRTEIEKNFDAIIDFSGIEQFLDTPLKHYSSGMQLRLAFSVAAFLEPEILVIDEVLAVGDAEFQKKCMGKMDEVSKSGRTILFVSHNMEAVRSLCSRGIFLKNGNVDSIGTVENVISKYLHNLSTEQQLHYKPETVLTKNGFSLVECSIPNSPDNGILTNGLDIGVHFKIINHEFKKFSIYMFVYRDQSLAFITSDLHDPCINKLANNNSPFEIQFQIPKYLLNPGNYQIGLLIADYNGNTEQYFNQMDLLNFELKDDGYRRGGRYNLGWSGSVSPILEILIKKN